MDLPRLQEFAIPLINQRLDELVPERTAAHQLLYEAARYALFPGGKRFRPLLTLAVAQIFGSSIDIALTPACALELVHTYSLIHDDLPCMDDDDFRRGRPTLHKAYPEGQAVLAGDFLLTYAFETLSTAPHLSDLQRITLVRLLAQAAGGEGMIGGQVLDLLHEGLAVDIHTLRDIHMRKTAALISVAVEFGAIIAHLPPQQLHILRSFGQELGLLFQIVDDIVDATDEEALGSDLLNDKATIVSLLSLQGARELASKQTSRISALLGQLPQDTTLLKELTEYVYANLTKEAASL